MSYSTKQKRSISNYIKKLNKDFTAKDIYEYFKGEIGLTTIYRFVETLEKDGTILRITTDENTTRYQYIKPCNHADHFYLKCEECGDLKHVDCKKIQGLTTHISEEHHFIPTNTNLIINGLCAKCARKENHEKEH